MELFFVLVPGLLILYAVWILCLQKKAKELKKKLWDNAGYKTTKNISTLYIDKNKKSWYVIGCPRVYKYSDIKYCQIIK